MTALGGAAAFGDGPDDERLAAAHVARGENAGNGTAVIPFRGDVAAGIELDAELLEHSLLSRVR